jgi:hypothetical protein
MTLSRNRVKWNLTTSHDGAWLTADGGKLSERVMVELATLLLQAARDERRNRAYRAKRRKERAT